MALFYLYGEDEKYYNDTGKKEVENKLKKQNIDLSVVFDEKELEDLILKSIKENKVIAALTPMYFHDLVTKYSAFIKIVKLENEYGLLTTQDKLMNVNVEEKLMSKLGSSVTKPNLTFDDYGGAKSLVAETEAINYFFELGMPVKGIFLAGIPGTGKSFFAKCLAGQLNRFLIELNLSKIIKAKDGLLLLEDFFAFFKNNPGHYIIWIDEIEKMFTGSEESTQVLGTLLTKINEFNANSGKTKSTAFIVATANDVQTMSKRNPEFFRNGRFDLLLNLKAPTDSGAKEIAQMYIEKNLKKHENYTYGLIYLLIKKRIKEIKKGSYLEALNIFINDNIDAFNAHIQDNKIDDIKDFIVSVKKNSGYLIDKTKQTISSYTFNIRVDIFVTTTYTIYRESSSDVERFPYVPAEIEYLINELYKYFLFYNFKLDEEIIKSFIEKNKPLQVTMSEAIKNMQGVLADFRQI